MRLPTETWIRFAVWIVIGFFIYFTYGIRNSSENPVYKRENKFEREKTFKS